MADKIYRVNVEKIAGRGVSGFIGEAGDLVYDPDTGTMSILDGSTPGGTEIGSTGTQGISGYSGISGFSGISGYSGVDGARGSFVPVGAVAPATAKGADGDVVGSVIVTATHIYFCTATWTDGNDDIWAKVALAAWA